MLHNAQAALVVAGLVGAMTAPFVFVMLVLFISGASAGAVIGAGFLALVATGFFVVSQRGQALLGSRLRKAMRRD